MQTGGRFGKFQINNSFWTLWSDEASALPSQSHNHDQKKRERKQQLLFHELKIKKPLQQQGFVIRIVTCYLIPKAFFTFGT